jgi:hypothetical protein
VIAEALIAAGMPPHAIVVGTDRNAISFVHALAAGRYELPARVAVVGSTTSPTRASCGRACPPSSQPLDRLGRVAYEIIAIAKSRRAAHRTDAFVARDSCGCPPNGLAPTEELYRASSRTTSYLQMTLNIQYELGIELLGGQGRDPLGLAWLGRTPALGGCLGLWPGSRSVPGRSAPSRIPLSRSSARSTPPAHRRRPSERSPGRRVSARRLFALADGGGRDHVRGAGAERGTRLGLLAAVGRIQDTTPPGRE